MLFFSEIFNILTNLPFMILHVISQNSFPKPLSKKEEEKYIKLFFEEKNIEAKNKLINHNLRLVAHIAKKYHLKNVDQDDLISIGTIGLIKSINTFKPEKSVRISSYAARCIENEILMHLRSSSKFSSDISIEEPVETDKNGNSLTLMDTIASDKSITEEIDQKIETEKLYKYITKLLNPREKIIMCLRYGLGGSKPLPQREVADKLKISRSYVSRLEKKSIDILKKSFK